MDEITLLAIVVVVNVVIATVLSIFLFGETSGIIITIITFALCAVEFCIFILIPDKIKMKKAQAKQNQKNIEMERERRIREEEEKVINFYCECEKRNVVCDSRNSECIKDMMLIASTMPYLGIKTKEQAIEKYKLGKTKMLEKAKREQSEKNNEQNEKLKAKYESEKAENQHKISLAEKSTKEKYLSALRSRYNDYEVVFQRDAAYAAMKKADNSIKPITKSTTAAYVAGSLVGGPLVGVANAHNTNLKNAAAEKKYEDNGKNRARFDREGREANSKIEQAEQKYRKCVEAVNKLVFDESNTMEKFKLLNITSTSCEVLESGNIEVSICIKINEDEVRLFNKPAYIDGSLKIEVLNSQGNVVATGCYTRDCNDVPKPFRENSLGFIRAICIADSCFSVNKAYSYTARITPIKLCFIEPMSDEVYNNNSWYPGGYGR